MKRLIEMLFALTLGILFFPVMLLITILIVCKSGFPIFFTQMRPGFHGKLFRVSKFRTMRKGAESDDERITPLGSVLRKTSLDELPQLWNVILGEMSFVGPRPLLEQYLHLYSGRQSKRHDVKPGITGWSQINGRNAPNWDDRLEMDVWYTEHQSFLLDLRIILKTVLKVISGSNVSAKGQRTVEPFRGSSNK